MEASESCTGMEGGSDLGDDNDDVGFDAWTGEGEAVTAKMNEERSAVPEVKAQIPIDQLAFLTGARPRTKPEKDAMRELELGMKHLRTGEAQDGNHKTSNGNLKTPSFRNR